jgi:hypothetical protein
MPENRDCRKGEKIVQVRKILVSSLVAGMVLIVPGAAMAHDGGNGLLGGVLGGNGGLLGGSGCNEDEIVSVGGDAGLVGLNLAGDLDTSHGVLGFGGAEDDLLSVGGDSGIVALGNGLETDHGLVGLNLSPCDD